MILPAERLQRIGTSASLEVAEQARALRAKGKPIIDLSLGEPDLRTPESVCESAIEMIRDGIVRYDSPAGTVTLRTAIASKLQRENNLTFGADEISVGCGAKQVISSALLATLDVGDEVIVPVPYWTSYPEMVRLAGGVPIFVRTSEKEGLRLTAESLAASVGLRTKWLILNSPTNPSGVVYSERELRGFAEVLKCEEHIGVISDEIYEHVVFPPHRFVSFASVAPELRCRTLTVNGVSKSYAMTGWRVGYGAGCKALISAINTVISQTTTHTSTVSQHAAAAALSDSQDVRKRYSMVLTHRATVAVELVRDLPGCTLIPPEGAFYCFINCSGLIGRRAPEVDRVLQSDVDVASYLLTEAGVAVVPGTAYGLSPYIRLSFAIDESVLGRAVIQMRNALCRLE